MSELPAPTMVDVPNVGRQYQVGNIVKYFLDFFVGRSPNRAYAGNWQAVLRDLAVLTESLWGRSIELGLSTGLLEPEPSYYQDAGRDGELPTIWRPSTPWEPLQAWEGRLRWYISEADASPATSRQDVLWTVTAPLLYGWYAGPDGMGKAPPLPPGTDVSVEQPADIATPFKLGNQLGALSGAQQEAWDKLVGDLSRPPSILGESWPSVLLGAAAVAGGAWVVAAVVKRSTS